MLLHFMIGNFDEKLIFGFIGVKWEKKQGRVSFTFYSLSSYEWEFYTFSPCSFSHYQM